MKCVVDTNVLINANRASHAEGDDECRQACSNFLIEFYKHKKIVILLDEGRMILKEYGGRCSHNQRRLGDAFFKFCSDHQHSSKKIKRISLDGNDPDGWFPTPPPKTFDDDDKKFLAVAYKGNGKVINSTDSGWQLNSAYVKGLGVEVIELCPHQIKLQA